MGKGVKKNLNKKNPEFVLSICIFSLGHKI